jgi:hypothetical protein
MNKIDLVYTWVNNKDPEWQKDFDKHCSYDSKATANRFDNCDELYYSILSARKYASNIINKIYVVISGMSQINGTKMQEVKDVIYITHKDIIDSKLLPTFNSVTIELHLYKIKGLSTNYLYMNDDMFFGNYVTVNDFFDKDGKALIFLDKSTHIPKKVKYDEYHFNTAINYTDSLLDKFKKKNERHLLQHLPYVHNKKCDKEIYNYLKSEGLYLSTCSRFRENGNVKVQSIFYPYYSIYHGYSKPYYNQMGLKVSENHQLYYDKIIKMQPKLLCLNKLAHTDDLNEFYKNMFF